MWPFPPLFLLHSPLSSLDYHRQGSNIPPVLVVRDENEKKEIKHAKPRLDHMDVSHFVRRKCVQTIPYSVSYGVRELAHQDTTTSSYYVLCILYILIYRVIAPYIYVL